MLGSQEVSLSWEELEALFDYMSLDLQCGSESAMDSLCNGPLPAWECDDFDSEISFQISRFPGIQNSGDKVQPVHTPSEMDAFVVQERTCFRSILKHPFGVVVPGISTAAPSMYFIQGVPFKDIPLEQVRRLALTCVFNQLNLGSLIWRHRLLASWLH